MRGSGKPAITRWTRKNKAQVMKLNALLLRLPDFPKDFRWTALQLGRDCIVHSHCDSNNLGPSVAVSVGSFTGGELVVDKVPHSSYKKVVCFDGRRPHYVADWTGHRASLIAFTHDATDTAPHALRTELQDMGFRCNVPPAAPAGLPPSAPARASEIRLRDPQQQGPEAGRALEANSHPEQAGAAGQEAPSGPPGEGHLHPLPRPSQLVRTPWDIVNGEEYNVLIEDNKKRLYSEALDSAMTWLGTDCKTNSRVRERPIRGVPRSQWPTPMRSKRYPEGMPPEERTAKRLRPLSWKEKTQMATGTALAILSLQLCMLLAANGKFFVLENPVYSWLWEFALARELLAMPGVFYVDLFACMFAPCTRRKQTRLLTNCPVLAGLARVCPEKGICQRTGLPHETFDPIVKRRRVVTYNTTAEAEYPAELCRSVAALVLPVLKTSGTSAIFLEVFGGPRAPLSQAMRTAIASTESPTTMPLQPCSSRRRQDEGDRAQTQVSPEPETPSTAPAPQDTQRRIIIEIFSGSGGLSAALSDRGVKAHPIDWKFNPHSLKRTRGGKVMRPILLDLSTTEGLGALQKELEQAEPVLDGVWIAFPSTSCAAAREREVADGPTPLRSAAAPWGLPELLRQDNHSKEAKLLKAHNMILTAVLWVLTWCIAKCIRLALENPRSSRLWDVPEIVDFAKRVDVHEVLFHVCRFGGLRRKSMKLLTTWPALRSLAGDCPGPPQCTSPHLPWAKRWSQGVMLNRDLAEAEYPQMLCNEFAAAITGRPMPVYKKFVEVQELDATTRAEGRYTSSDPLGELRVAAGRQMRPSRAKPLIPEWKRVIRIEVPEDIANQWDARFRLVKKLDSEIVHGESTVPAGATYLGMSATTAKTGACGSSLTAAFGVPWPKAEFAERACRLEHPFDSVSGVQDAVREAIFKIATKGPKATAAHRDRALRWWQYRAKVLEPKEKALHDAMPPGIASVLKGKRILLLQDMLQSIKHPDKNLVADMVAGFPIAGDMGVSGVFKQREDVEQPSTTEAELMREARSHQRSAASHVKPSGNADLDRAVWERTLEEADQDGPLRTLRGPFEPEELDERWGPLWIPSVRFGVMQGQKMREIDDFSLLGINATILAREKVVLRGLDDVVATSRLLGSCVDWDAKSVEVPMSNGQVWSGPLGPDWTEETLLELLGRCADLSGAYKQFARLLAQGHLSIIAVWDPEQGRPRYFEAWGLMFGNSGSVYGFNRCAKAMEAILVKTFLIPTTNFFDDYPMVEYAGTAESAAKTVDAVGELLGWKWKSPEEEAEKKRLRAQHEPPKAVPQDDPSEDELVEEDRVELVEDGKPQRVFVALGALVDLTQARDGVLRVRNKPGRARGILRDVKLIRKAQRLTPHEASVLQGRLRYAGSNAFGKRGARALRALATIAGGVAPQSLEGPSYSWLLDEVCRVVRAAPPKDVRIRGPVGRPAVVMTDGACEQNGQLVTVGGVLFPADRSRPRWFTWRVSDAMLAAWRARVAKEQVIHEAEVLPAVLSRRIWAEWLRGQRVLHFVDQEAARLNLIRGYATGWPAAELIDAFWEEEQELQSGSWMERVQSDANIADPASRNEVAFMRGLGIQDEVLPEHVRF